MNKRKHILLVETKNEGHHPLIVSALGEGILANGHQLTLAMPKNLTSRERLAEAGCEWLSQVEWVDWKAADTKTMLKRSSDLVSLGGADAVFFACLDEVISAMLRKAALGWRPPVNLRSNLSGLYIRPRALDPDCRVNGPNALLKRMGWNALDRGGWFDQIFVLDERLPTHPRRKQSNATLRFMPEPCGAAKQAAMPKSEARAILGIPDEVVVFLQYGLGTRRKGLHHVISAWKTLPSSCRAFLLVAGETESRFREDLERLQDAGCAKLLMRYVTREEEAQVFTAADVVLLAYVNHYGSSNVLSRSAAAGRMVLASDSGLIGYRVRQYQLGELCDHNNSQSLRIAVERLASGDITARDQGFSANLREFSRNGLQHNINKLFAA